MENLFDNLDNSHELHTKNMEFMFEKFEKLEALFNKEYFDKENNSYDGKELSWIRMSFKYLEVKKIQYEQLDLSKLSINQKILLYNYFHNKYREIYTEMLFNQIEIPTELYEIFH